MLRETLSEVAKNMYDKTHDGQLDSLMLEYASKATAFNYITSDDYGKYISE